MLAGASREQIAEYGALNEPPFGRQLVYQLYAAICKELSDAASLPEFARQSLRAQAVERLRRELLQLRNRREGLNDSQHDTYISMTRELRHLESLLADVEGTKQLEVHVGVDIDVRVRSASMRVIANLTREDFAEMGRELVGRS